MSIKSFFGVDRSSKNLTTVVNTFASIPLLEFKLVRFKDKTHKKPKFRFWVAFRFEDEAFCVLNTVTTQIDYIARMYKNDEKGANSVVTIPQEKIFPPLYEHSYIDCNIKAINYKTYRELAENIIDWNDGLIDCPEKIPDDIKKEIITAILNSPYTSNDIKKAFKEKLETN